MTIEFEMSFCLKMRLTLASTIVKYRDISKSKKKNNKKGDGNWLAIIW